MAPSDEQKASRSALTRDTLVPISVAIAAMMAFVSGAVWLNGTLQRIDFALVEIRRDLKGVSDRLDVSISRSAFVQWTELLQARNPDVNVPEFR